MRKLIYSSAGSPFARKVRIVLHEKALDYDQDVRPGLRPVDELKALNPNLALPVLMDDNETLFGSNLIIEYLLDRYGGTSNAEGVPFANWMTRLPTRWSDLKILTTIEAFADTMVNVRHFRSDGSTSPYMARQVARMNSCLDWLDGQATPTGFWPGHFSILDIALICPLHYAETRRVIQWRQRPNLAALYEHWRHRASVVATVEPPLKVATAV
jgi:glutathione S-transferase